MRLPSRKYCFLWTCGIPILYILLYHVRFNIKIGPSHHTKHRETFRKDINRNMSKVRKWRLVPARESVNNIYYVKIHKTGSTTLQNVISRYGLKNNLSFVAFDCSHGMAFPNPPYPGYILGHSSQNSYNIIAEHTKFDPEVYKSYMTPETMVFSQLRYPMKYLSSLFGFEFLYNRFHLGKRGNPLRRFLENPDEYDSRANWQAGSEKCTPIQQPSFTKNSMAYHLGYTDSNVTEHSIKQFLSTLDKHLSFVIITEKFDESMILLKQLLHWNMSDILYLPRGSLAFNDRVQFEVGQNDSDKSHLIDLHMHWSPVDYILYNHFHKKLVATLSEQTRSFWEEVKYFKGILHELKDFCSSMCSSVNDFYKITEATEATRVLSVQRQHFEASNWNEKFRVSYLDCVQMVLVTEDYQLAIRAKQAPAYCYKKSRAHLNVGFNKQFCISEDHLLFNFPWLYVKERLFSSYGQCKKYVNG